MGYLVHVLLVSTFCVIATHQQTCSTQANSDINLPNLASRNGTAQSACCGICSSTSGCRAYSWNDYQGGTCWLKAGTGPIVGNSGVTTGVLSGGSDTFRVVAFYHGTWDVAHISFCREANRWFPTVAAANGFTFESTTDWSKLNDNFLAGVNVILLWDDKPQDNNQKAAFQRFAERGGGIMIHHVSAFTTNANEWAWYHNTFLGSGTFQKNTWKPTSATLQVENRPHPATANLPDTFRAQPNEWYHFNGNLQGNNKIKILLSIHPNSFPLGTNPGETWHDGYHPVVWTNTDYRMLYINMGHNDIDYEHGNADLSATFGDAVQNRLFLDGLKWLAQGTSTVKQDQSPLMRAFGY